MRGPYPAWHQATLRVAGPPPGLQVATTWTPGNETARAALNRCVLVRPRDQVPQRVIMAVASFARSPSQQLLDEFNRRVRRYNQLVELSRR